ncbi:MAG: cation:proton antiporter [Patescibacteria group bacterium]|nr:cation:proton antiporter [Patescibacteria group bacterium]
MPTGIFELAIVVLIAAVLGIAAKLTKQPVVLAYLATGAIIAYFGFFNIADKEAFYLFSDLGIMFLLFLVGMEINYTSLRLVGRASFIIGLGQVIFTFIGGFLIAFLLNYDYLTSAYISIALTFSSTIIVIKLLSEKKDLNSLYGKISVGILLIQDIVVILLLIILAGFEAQGNFVIKDIIFTIIKGLALFGAMAYLGRKIFPPVFKKIAHSQELLFLTSIAWLFVTAAGVSKLGFSIEIGGFLAGLALANSSEHFQIASRVRSLRDFFILIFFVILGATIAISDLSNLTWPIIIFSLFVLIGNPLIVLAIMGLIGYRRRTSFMCGVTVAQISEFSLVLAAMGAKVGHITNGAVSLITAVGIITITLSTYMIIYAENIFRRFSPVLRFFEKQKSKEDGPLFKEFHKPIILIGCHRTGQNIAFSIPKEDLLIVEFDPDVISQLRKMGYDYVFGDITDPDIFEAANFNTARLIISTSPDLEDNLFLLSQLNLLENRNQIKVITRARMERDAEILYANGADYVLLPHFTAGQYLSKTIALDPEMKILTQLKDQDMEIMKRKNHIKL